MSSTQRCCEQATYQSQCEVVEEVVRTPCGGELVWGGGVDPHLRGGGVTAASESTCPTGMAGATNIMPAVKAEDVEVGVTYAPRENKVTKLE